MEQTIKLDGNTAKQMYKVADAAVKALLEKNFTKAFFSEKIIDRVQTFDDILNISGVTMYDILPWKNPKNKKQIVQNGLAKLQCVQEVYNEDKEKDWTNKNTYAYINIWVKKARGGWSLHCTGGCGYCYYFCGVAGCYFATKELAEDAASKFKDIYIETLPE